MQNIQLAFLGLGVMGAPMAAHLYHADNPIKVYNRSAEKAQAWLTRTGAPEQLLQSSISDAVDGADVIFMCLGADHDVLSLCFAEDGLFSAVKPGAIIVDHTTTSADCARKLSLASAAKGCAFLDAPVSGGQQGAENGALTVMVGGDELELNKVLPMLQCFAKKVELIGESGAGQLAKMVNQICIAGLVQGLAEGLSFAKNAGLDVQKVVDVISQGAAQSWQMDNRATTMINGEFDFGFAVDWMRKDLDYALAEGRRNGSSLPVTAMVDQFYSEVQKMGGNRWDTSSLMARQTKDI